MSEIVTVLGMAGRDVDQLAPPARTLLAEADIIIGGTALLAAIQPAIKAGADCRDLTGKLMQVTEWIEEATANGQRVLVLASGDPLCFGIGHFLIKKLGVERVQVRPDVSSLQWACARLGISWSGAHMCSVHHRDSGEWVDAPGREHGLYPLFRACMDQSTILALTSPANNPARIARMLLAEGWAEDFRLMVAARLQCPDEQIWLDTDIAALADMSFPDPNVVVLQRLKPHQQPTPLFGLPDDHFAQRKPEKGLITKQPVRAVSLAQLALRPDSIVWDIGAGSGAVGLEAARLCPDGWVYAIEKNAADIAIARQNQQAMNVHHYTLIHGKAPQGMEHWPDPDAVFIGGSGGELTTLMEQIMARLRPGGVLVMNFVTLENLHEATATLKRLGASWHITQLQTSRSQPILHMHRMAADNPVWVVSASFLCSFP